ncbi:MAG: formyltransferase family protein [Syntrophorhabdales bacterium]|jgi:folate-dependent phosphoribosylglycinamide formyltransferase PurN
MRICWFTTGRDNEAFTLFRDVLAATDAGVIEGAVTSVFLNRESGESAHADAIITLAEARAIPVETLGTKKFLESRGLGLDAGRGLFDAEVYGRIRRFGFDVIFLAGYMLILSPVLFDAFPVLNIHPSLPGAYKGKWEDVINRTIDDGKRTFGAMTHMVEAVLDEGAPVAFVRVTLEGPEIEELYGRAKRGDEGARGKLFGIVRAREFEVETPLIIQTLALLSKGVLEIRKKRVFFKGKEVRGGMDITTEVERWLATRT